MNDLTKTDAEDLAKWKYLRSNIGDGAPYMREGNERKYLSLYLCFIDVISHITQK